MNGQIERKNITLEQLCFFPSITHYPNLILIFLRGRRVLIMYSTSRRIDNKRDIPDDSVCLRCAVIHPTPNAKVVQTMIPPFTNPKKGVQSFVPLYLVGRIREPKIYTRLYRVRNAAIVYPLSLCQLCSLLLPSSLLLGFRLVTHPSEYSMPPA